MSHLRYKLVPILAVNELQLECFKVSDRYYSYVNQLARCLNVNMHLPKDKAIWETLGTKYNQGFIKAYVENVRPSVKGVLLPLVNDLIHHYSERGFSHCKVAKTLCSIESLEDRAIRAFSGFDNSLVPIQGRERQYKKKTLKKDLVSVIQNYCKTHSVSTVKEAELIVMCFDRIDSLILNAKSSILRAERNINKRIDLRNKLSLHYTLKYNFVESLVISYIENQSLSPLDACAKALIEYY